jgi:SpoVK/Ycf46/Vps4 family AAA+-type ATPase
MLVKALANECDIKLITSQTPELFCMTLNTIEDNVHNVFDEARKIAPCILFIDSLDCSSKRKKKQIDNFNYIILFTFLLIKS